MNLKIALVRCGSVVLGTVLEQEGIDRGDYYHSYNGFTIVSDRLPALLGNWCYLGGPLNYEIRFPSFLALGGWESAFLPAPSLLEAFMVVMYN